MVALCINLHQKCDNPSLKEIRKIRELTIIVSEQVLSFTLEIADRFLVIDKGRLVYEDSKDKVDAATISLSV